MEEIWPYTKGDLLKEIIASKSNKNKLLLANAVMEDENEHFVHIQI